MEPAILYLIERGLLIAAIVGLAVYAIYQWKVAKVKPSLLEKFKREAEAEIRKKLSDEISEQENLIEHNKGSIRNAQLWLTARKCEAMSLAEPVRADLHEVRSECQKISRASKNLTEASKLIEVLSGHKNFIESLTKSQKSRIQSTAREAKTELKAVDSEVTQLLERVAKAVLLINSSEWIHDQPPVKREQEPNDETVD